MARILVIDDEKAIRNLIRYVLVAAGHDVREAGEGDAGLALLREEVPDLVVCDLFMPGREGIATIREVRRGAPSVPIVVISGGGQWGLLETLEDAAVLGATIALPKPISPAVLLQVITALLSGNLESLPLCPEVRRNSPTSRSICSSIRSCSRAGNFVSCGASNRGSSPEPFGSESDRALTGTGLAREGIGGPG